MTNDNEDMARQPSYDEMESLFVNNENLSRIEAYLGRFNPIRVMRMEHMEIRHSAILAWLMDPNETHGFGDRFLKAFLCEALRGQEGGRKPTALDVSRADLRDAEIRREKKNIDVFVASASNGWAFVIENKFHSKQHSGQLKRYIKQTEKEAEDAGHEFQISGIFLTLHDEDPEADARSNYVTLGYENICTILETQLSDGATNTGPEVRQFLEHYLEIIRDAAGMSEERNEMEKLARELYRDHKKVLDFVMEHGASSDFAIAARNLFGENPEFLAQVNLSNEEGNELLCRFCGLNKKEVSFLPESWFVALGGEPKAWLGCEDWWAGFPVILFMRILPGMDGVKGTLRLYAEVGPLANHDARTHLINCIKEAGKKRGPKSLRISFQKGAADPGKKYSRFLKNNSAPINDIQDAEEIERKIRELYKKFQREIEAVSEVLGGFKVSSGAGNIV